MATTAGERPRAPSLSRGQTGDSFAVFGFADLVSQSVFDQQDAIGGLRESIVVRMTRPSK